MAALKNLSALMILLVATVALLPRAIFATGGNLDCAKGMTKDCGSQLLQITVFASTVPPTDECCRELVKSGKNCQNQFVELILSSNKPINGTRADVYRRSNETWNHCIAVTNSVSPSEPAH